MRLNKYLADCGIASRRACDKLIEEGKVKVNGKIAKVGCMVEEDVDRIEVVGKRLEPKKRDYYIVLHKPKGYVTTSNDEFGRKTVMDLIDIKSRLYPVGRLDYDTEGLLILTNDGYIANKLTHPSHEIDKVYIARVSGELTRSEISQLEKGVMVDGIQTAPAIVQVMSGDEHHTRVKITIHDGRNRQVKKMFEAVGREVEFLKRTSVGKIKLGGLSRGTYRFCSQKEIDYLRSL